jgi:hypothetical protein
MLEAIFSIEKLLRYAPEQIPNREIQTRQLFQLIRRFPIERVTKLIRL